MRVVEEELAELRRRQRNSNNNNRDEDNNNVLSNGHGETSSSGKHSVEGDEEDKRSNSVESK